MVPGRIKDEGHPNQNLAYFVHYLKIRPEI